MKSYSDIQIKANCKQTAVKLTANKPNHANPKQTKEITYITVLTALVQYRSVHDVENVGIHSL